MSRMTKETYWNRRKERQRIANKVLAENLFEELNKRGASLTFGYGLIIENFLNSNGVNDNV